MIFVSPNPLSKQPSQWVFPNDPPTIHFTLRRHSPLHPKIAFDLGKCVWWNAHAIIHAWDPSTPCDSSKCTRQEKFHWQQKEQSGLVRRLEADLILLETTQNILTRIVSSGNGIRSNVEKYDLILSTLLHLLTILRTLIFKHSNAIWRAGT